MSHIRWQCLSNHVLCCGCGWGCAQADVAEMKQKAEAALFGLNEMAREEDSVDEEFEAMAAAVHREIHTAPDGPYDEGDGLPAIRAQTAPDPSRDRPNSRQGWDFLAHGEVDPEMAAAKMAGRLGKKVATRRKQVAAREDVAKLDKKLRRMKVSRASVHLYDSTHPACQRGIGAICTRACHD